MAMVILPHIGENTVLKAAKLVLVKQIFPGADLQFIGLAVAIFLIFPGREYTALLTHIVLPGLE